MKKLNLFLALFMSIFILSSCVKSSKFSTKELKDANGYVYKTSKKDPDKAQIYTLKKGLTD